MVAGEGREGARWFAGQIGDDAGDRLGRTARALVLGDREQAVDQPRWLAGSRETRARLVNGFVDETQWPADRGIRMRRRAKCGELHDMSNPSVARCRNRMSLQLGRVCNVAGQQKQFRATREDGAQSLWLREISIDPGGAGQRLSPAGIAD